MTTLLRTRTARFVVGSAAAGSLADWTLFAAMVATVDALLGGGPWAVAAVVVARLLPGVAFAPLAARRADRGDLDVCLLRHEALRVAAVATIAAGAATRSVPLALAGVVGFEYGAAMLAAARESLISRHVPRTLFTPVNTATAVLSYGSLPIGAAVVAAAAPALGFAVALLGYAGLALAYALLRPSRSASSPASGAPEVTAGAQLAAEPHPGVAGGTPWRTVAAAALGLMPAVGLFAVAPSLAALWLGERTATGVLFGFVLAGGAAGCVAANLRPSLHAAVPLGVAAGGTLLAATGRWQLGLTVLGAGAGAAYLALQNRLQHEASDPSQFARAFAILKVATGIAVVGAPALASAASLPLALAVLAALPVAAAAITLGGPATVVRLLVRETVGLVLRALLAVRVEGDEERVAGPCVVVSNHPHVLDGPVAVAADRSLRPVARWQRNVGHALVRELLGTAEVDTLVAVARRPPGGTARDGDVEWHAADIATDDLVPLFRGADAVVHLAWLIQPGRDLERLWAVNVDGTVRVLAAVAEAGVGALVYASSIGAYSPGADAGPVDESFPTHGIATSSYSRQKAYVERLLDTFTCDHPEVRVVRLRPGLIFSRDAAEEQRRFFAGTLVPRTLLRPGVLPALPHLAGMRFQALHSDDVADAYRRAITSDVRGAFNLAAEPVLTTRDAADLLEARPVRIPHRLARWAAAATWHARLHPAEPGWLDLALRSPVMDTTRARDVLGWSPRHDAHDALRAVLGGIADGSGADTPTLAPGRRLEEVRTGHGARYSADPRAEAPGR